MDHVVNNKKKSTTLFSLPSAVAKIRIINCSYSQMYSGSMEKGVGVTTTTACRQECSQHPRLISETPVPATVHTRSV